eukprot:gene16205-22369_t
MDDLFSALGVTAKTTAAIEKEVLEEYLAPPAAEPKAGGDDVLETGEAVAEDRPLHRRMQAVLKEIEAITIALNPPKKDSDKEGEGEEAEPSEAVADASSALQTAKLQERLEWLHAETEKMQGLLDQQLSKAGLDNVEVEEDKHRTVPLLEDDPFEDDAGGPSGAGLGGESEFVETEKDRLIRKGLLTPFDCLKGFEMRVESNAAAGPSKAGQRPAEWLNRRGIRDLENRPGKTGRSLKESIVSIAAKHERAVMNMPMNFWRQAASNKKMPAANRGGTKVAKRARANTLPRASRRRKKMKKSGGRVKEEGGVKEEEEGGDDGEVGADGAGPSSSSRRTGRQAAASGGADDAEDGSSPMDGSSDYEPTDDDDEDSEEDSEEVVDVEAIVEDARALGNKRGRGPGGATKRKGRSRLEPLSSSRGRKGGRGGRGRQQEVVSGEECNSSDVSKVSDGEADEFDDDDDDWFQERLSRAEMAREEEQEADPVEDVTFSGGYRIPNDIYCRLFDYQQTAVKWMWELHTQRAGGVLGDDMGLGKTIQVIVYLVGLLHSHMYRPTIVICPATVMRQWMREVRVWAPKLRVFMMHDSARSPPGRPRPSRADLVARCAQSPTGLLLTSYEQLRAHRRALLSVRWGYAILDEGHKIRNPDAEVTLVCKQLQTVHRIIMSGTPIQNQLSELWSLFDFIFPGKLGTLPVFQAQFAVPIKIGGYTNASQLQVSSAYKCAVVLRDLIAPYMLRRRKTDVNVTLTKKTEQVLFCNLTLEQRELYRSYLASEEVSGILEGSRNSLAGIDILRKICNHPDLLERVLHEAAEDYGNPDRSGKLTVTKKLLTHWLEGGHKALVFTQTQQMLDILEKLLQRLGYRYHRMDGSTSVGQRSRLMDDFNNNPDVFAFLLTTKVGGLGVNLIGADRVLLYDPDWNPASDIQARERAWRVGQTRDVTIYRLITSGAIEEKIYQRQIYKGFLTDKILRDPRQRRFFTARDVRDLFTLGDEHGGPMASARGQDGATETARIFGDLGRNVVVDLTAGKAEQQDDPGREGVAVGDGSRRNMEVDASARGGTSPEQRQPKVEAEEDQEGGSGAPTTTGSLMDGGETGVVKSGYSGPSPSMWSRGSSDKLARKDSSNKLTRKDSSNKLSRTVSSNTLTRKDNSDKLTRAVSSNALTRRDSSSDVVVLDSDDDEPGAREMIDVEKPPLPPTGPSGLRKTSSATALKAHTSGKARPNGISARACSNDGASTSYAVAGSSAAAAAPSTAAADDDDEFGGMSYGSGAPRKSKVKATVLMPPPSSQRTAARPSSRPLPNSRPIPVPEERGNPIPGGNEEGDAKILRDLFEGSSTLHSLVDHSRIESANDPEVLAIDDEASRVAKRAAEALKRSRQECAAQPVSMPTWTGRRGASGAPSASSAPPRRFGNVTSPNAVRQNVVLAKEGSQGGSPGERAAQFGGGIAGTSGVAGAGSSSDLLAKIRERQGMGVRGGGSSSTQSPPRSGPNGQHDDDASMLMAVIISFIETSEGGEVPSATLVDHFRHQVGESQMPLFRQLLKQVASLKRRQSGGVWVLKPEFCNPR